MARTKNVNEQNQTGWMNVFYFKMVERTLTSFGPFKLYKHYTLCIIIPYNASINYRKRECVCLLFTLLGFCFEIENDLIMAKTKSIDSNKYHPLCVYVRMNKIPFIVFIDTHTHTQTFSKMFMPSSIRDRHVYIEPQSPNTLPDTRTHKLTSFCVATEENRMRTAWKR